MLKKREIKTKKSQAGILVNILLILIAIAAIAIVSIFVIKFVRNSVADGQLRMSASQIEVYIKEKGSNYILLAKNSENSDIQIKELAIFVNGKKKQVSYDSLSGWGALETKKVTFNDYTLVPGDKIEVSALIGTNTSSIAYVLVKEDITGVSSSISPNPAVDSIILGWWDFDNDDIPKVVDKSVYSINGTSTAISYVTGKSGNALRLQGSLSSFVSLPVQNLPYGSSQRTICAWANTSTTTSPSQYAFIFSYGGDTQGGAFYIGRNYGHLLCGGFGISYDISVTSFWANNLNQWKYICCSYDGSTIRLYADGQMQIMSVKSLNTLKNSAFIGKQIVGSEYWTGTVDELRIYNRTLSDSEILALYNSYS
jgi:hypothetical protein